MQKPELPVIDQYNVYYLEDVIDAVGDLRTYSAYFNIDIYDVCEQCDISAYHYDKWVEILKNCRKPKIYVKRQVNSQRITVEEQNPYYTEHPSLRKAVSHVLSMDEVRKKISGRYMRFAPRNKHIRDNTYGVQEGYLDGKYMGQPVQVLNIKHGSEWVEIIEPFDKKWCGVVNKKDLVELDDDLQQRVAFYHANNSLPRADDDKEIVEKAAAIKKRNLQKMEEERKQKEKERELKRIKKNQKGASRAAILNKAAKYLQD